MIELRMCVVRREFACVQILFPTEHAFPRVSDHRRSGQCGRVKKRPSGRFFYDFPLSILLGYPGRFIGPIVCASYLPFRIRLCTLNARAESS